jgi:hypothetical protein
MKSSSKFIGHLHGDCLVNHNQKIAYIPIPKNASTSLRRMLSGSNFTLGNLHSFDYKEYETFTIIRDPLTRFVSGYIESNKRRYPYIQSLPYFNMPESSKRIINALKQISPKFLDEHLKPQSDFLRTFKIKKFILFEKLSEGFSIYEGEPWFKPFGHAIATPANKLINIRIYITPAIVAMIKKVYEKDFKLYEKHNN